MSDKIPNNLRKILAFAAVVEIGTGLVLMIDPAIVVTLLLGAEVSGAGTLLCRFFGIALLALGLACWPDTPLIGMFTYSAAVTLYLAYAGIAGGFAGILLWPAVALHGILTVLLARAMFARGKTADAKA